MITIEEYFKGEDSVTIEWMKKWYNAISNNMTFLGWVGLDTELRFKYHAMAVKYIRYMEEYIDQNEEIQGEHVGDY